MIEQDIRVLRMFFRTAQRNMIRDMNSGTEFSRQENAMTLSRINYELGILKGKTQKWLNNNMSKYYAMGANDGTDLVALVDRERERALLDNAGVFDRYSGGGGVVKQSKDPFNRAFESIQRIKSPAEQKKLAQALANIIPPEDGEGRQVLKLLNSFYDIQPQTFPLAPPPINYSFNRLDITALAAMTDAAFQDFGRALTGVSRTTETLLNDAQRRRITSLLAEGRISRQTLREIKNNIAGELSKGFVALRDKAGKLWDIEVYAENLARTKLAEATREGMFNRLVASGYDLVQITVHLTNCKLCLPWEGVVLSITGKTEGYPTVQEAKDTGLFHNNCKHRPVPYHERFAKESEVWSQKYRQYVDSDLTLEQMKTFGFDVDHINELRGAKLDDIKLDEFQREFMERSGLKLDSDVNPFQQVSGSVGTYNPSRNVISLNPNTIEYLKRYRGNDALRQVFFHEFGHAIDHRAGFIIDGVNGRLSNSDEFTSIAGSSPSDFTNVVKRRVLNSLDPKDRATFSKLSDKQWNELILDNKSVNDLKIPTSTRNYYFDPDELFAESYSIYINDPEYLRETAPSVYNFIDNIMKRNFK